jgi:ubiquitin-protein ligase
MDKNRLRKTRLHKEEISLDKDPLENAFVKREGDLNFYFCLYDLEDDFTNGFYFGLLQLHHEYPFYAPKLFMYTPNGRYE